MATLQSKIETATNKLTRDFTALVKQNVTTHIYENGDVCAFGSELACYKLAYIYKHMEVKVSYSENLKSNYILITGMLKSWLSISL